MPPHVVSASWRTPFFFLLMFQGCSGSTGSHDQGLLDVSPAPDQSLPDQRPDVAARPDGGSTLGAPCKSDLECSAGLRCDLALPDGLCTRDCTANADCGDERHAGCRSGRCHPRCNVRAIVNPCRDKYACRLDQARGLCVPDCRVQGCPDDPTWVCDANSGLCVDPSAGTLGASCGATTGTCDGTPNGVCYTVNALTDGFCTLPCSPFTKPCPLEIQGAECVLGAVETPYCAFLCDPTAPSCPHPDLSCTSLGDLNVCLPQM